MRKASNKVVAKWSIIPLAMLGGLLLFKEAPVLVYLTMLMTTILLAIIAFKRNKAHTSTLPGQEEDGEE